MIYLFIAICTGLYAIYCLKYWDLKRVPCLPLKFSLMSPLCLIDGLRVVRLTNMNQHYQEMKAKRYKYAGIVTSIRSVLIVSDLRLIRDVLMKYKHLFADRGFHYTDRYEPQIENIVVLDGSKWEEMRSILSPKVLSRNLEHLFDVILNATAYLIEALEDCSLEKRDIDVKELFACFTTDIITYHCYKINCYSYRRSPLRFCKCKLDILSSMGQRTAQERVSSLLYLEIRKNMKYREASSYKDIDYFSLNFFLKDWSEGQEEPILFFQAIERTNLFFYYSFDISSTTLNFAVYELSRNPDIQNKVRNEINDVLEKNNNVITWNILRCMKYLDQVIDETLRLYPPAANLIEVCEIKGCKLDDIDINTLTDIVIPLFSLHRDPAYFVDPEKFDPERFDEAKKHKNPPFYMPYGEGPRAHESIQACMMQTKIGLVQILRNFRLSISARTPVPLRLNPQAFLSCDDTIYITATKYRTLYVSI